MNRFVVESPAYDQNGVRRGTFRLYVATEPRAIEVASAHPGRTWRPLTDEELAAPTKK